MMTQDSRLPHLKLTAKKINNLKYSPVLPLERAWSPGSEAGKKGNDVA